MYTQRRMFAVLLTTIAISVPTTRCHGETLFYDDFQDGELADDMPVSWVPFNQGESSAVDGDLIATLTNDNYFLLTADIGEQTDVSMRTQFRLVEFPDPVSDELALEFIARGNAENVEAYLLGLFEDGEAYIWHTWGTGHSVLASTQTELRPLEEDVVLQADVIGDELSLWAWRTNEPMPKEPVVDVISDTLSQGVIGFDISWKSPGSSVALKYFHAATEHIGAILDGDYNFDGTVSGIDLDLQSSALVNPTPDLMRFDHDNDGAVTTDDRLILVHEYLHTWIGDSNLDGQFNSGDLVAVFDASKFENEVQAGWSDGDWNGDGYFDSSDFVMAFQDGGYEKGVRVPAVPEPTCELLMLLASTIPLFRRKGLA
ncbi:MAG: hypothetical protein KDB27_31420 [Planctomycetales bacterium]|nr:hypothetical protein [Planctomycetales bacterium]